jgi:molybdenum cofactor cytidylyltransferase
VRGNPVLFDRTVFDELRAVTGDEGGRSVVARDPGRVVLVEIDAEMPADVDTPEDLNR